MERRESKGRRVVNRLLQKSWSETQRTLSQGVMEEMEEVGGVKTFGRNS